ncbi:MAG: PrsW family intramembrane metalloprotease [Chloroflexi bacterium]|nr:PrsW family intramembrane metalloprotease [Chloroflexota bacterium]
MISEQALKFTGNPHYSPTVILLGAFAIPMAFVAYFYSQERELDQQVHSLLPLTLLLVCFLIGGTVGIIVAGVLEHQILNDLDIPGLLGVGLIEESAKLILPLAIYLRWSYRSEADGLLFGVAAGMGFSALETAGYGMVALIDSQGSVGSMQEVLLVRGFLSPAGHAAWTGLVCAVMWRERGRTGHLFNWKPVGMFLFVVLLHTAWNIGSGLDRLYFIFAAYVAVGGTSLGLLIQEIRRTRHSRLVSVVPGLAPDEERTARDGP